MPEGPRTSNVERRTSASHRSWWLLLVVSLFVICAWPPAGDRSLIVKFVNWVVDPTDSLPVLPEQLALGQGDNPDAVAAHDQQVQHYDALYMKGGWTRQRLLLKVARDPFNPATERQLLLAILAMVALVTWRRAASPRPASRREDT